MRSRMLLLVFGARFLLRVGRSQAVLCGGLFPNVAVAPKSLMTGCVDTKGLKKAGESPLAAHHGTVYLHPSCINCEATTIDSRFLIYNEVVKTSKVYLRDSTTVSPPVLLLFGGRLVVHHEKEVISLNLDKDRFLHFRAPRKVATVVKLLRRATEELLLRKITHPLERLTEAGEGLIAAVAALLDADLAVRALETQPDAPDSTRDVGSLFGPTAPPQPLAALAPAFTPVGKPGDWGCVCGALVFASKNQCFKCRAPRVGAAMPQQPSAPEKVTAAAVAQKQQQKQQQEQQRGRKGQQRQGGEEYLPAPVAFSQGRPPPAAVLAIATFPGLSRGLAAAGGRGPADQQLGAVSSEQAYPALGWGAGRQPQAPQAQPKAQPQAQPSGASAQPSLLGHESNQPSRGGGNRGGNQHTQQKGSVPPWNCPLCTFTNSAFLKSCEMCGTDSPAAKAAAPVAAGQGGGEGIGGKGGKGGVGKGRKKKIVEKWVMSGGRGSAPRGGGELERG